MHRHKILVVDDEIHNLHALERALRQEYKVLSATNEEDALTVIENNDIAAIVSECHMPGMTGINLLAEIRNKYPDVIRIVFAYIDEELLLNAINMANIHSFITKPWEPEELKNSIKKWIEYYYEADSAEMLAQQPGERSRAAEASEQLLKKTRQIQHLLKKTKQIRELEEQINLKDEKIEELLDQIKKEQEISEDNQRQLEEMIQPQHFDEQLKLKDEEIAQLSSRLEKERETAKVNNEDRLKRIMELHRKLAEKERPWWRRLFNRQ